MYSLLKSKEKKSFSHIYNFGNFLKIKFSPTP